METFYQWRKKVNHAWPFAGITYGENSSGVNWAQAWVPETHETLATWERNPKPVLPVTPTTSDTD